MAIPLLDAISYEYHFTATRHTGSICLLVGVAIVAALALAVFLIARRRK